MPSKIIRPIDVIGRVSVEIAKNFAMRVPVIRRLRAKRGRTSSEPSRDNLNRYVFDLINKLREHYGDMSDKSILEIGPGDNLVTGLAMLALGAKSYAVLDRFPGDYSSLEARKWYQLLRENWPYGAWPGNLDHTLFPNLRNVSKYDSSVEGFKLHERYDVVCSYAVGEHVSDVRSFAELNKLAIKGDGIGLHVVDFGGHQWDRYGDPFLFMKFPDAIWNLMGSARGEPNRIRFSPFARFFADAGLKVEVKDIRRFEFNQDDVWVTQRADESFLVSEATIILRKSC